MVLTPAVNKAVASQANICDMLEQIRIFHKKLGWPGPDTLYNLEEHRTLSLGLMAESAEVLNAAPWKPWKTYNTDLTDICDLAQVRLNIAEELVDVLFFMSSIMEVWGINEQYFAEAFKNKLAVNYERLNNGYNARPTEER